MSCGVSDHCCWLAGQPCPHLEENTVPGRRWACGLMRVLGSWPAVHASPEYQADVRPHWDAFRRDGDCGDWPLSGETCATCGQVSNG